MFRTNNLMPLVRSLDLGFLDDIANEHLKSLPPNLSMKVDISEDSSFYEVVADLPGFSKENIDIDYKEGILTVTAKRLEQSAENEVSKKLLRSERVFGEAKRIFKFAEPIDSKSLKASYVDGVLSITLPKKEKQELTTKVTIL